MKAKNYENAAKIYSRCLFPSWKCPNIELWKSYVTYVRTVKSANNREEIIKAYEFALENVGMDINSTHLWSDYVSFLKEQKVNY